MSGWDGESNESMYEWFGMAVTVKGVDCGVVEWVRWFGHVMRMQENEFVKRVYEGGIDGGGVKGRPPVKWINRVSKY